MFDEPEIALSHVRRRVSSLYLKLFERVTTVETNTHICNGFDLSSLTLSQNTLMVRRLATKGSSLTLSLK